MYQISACPENCETCTYDSTDKKVVCSKCSTGFGLLKAKTCGGIFVPYVMNMHWVMKWIVKLEMIISSMSHQLWCLQDWIWGNWWCSLLWHMC